MAKTIYKYQLGFDGEIVNIKGHISKFLNIKFQPGQGMMIWAEVDEEKCKEIEIPVVAIGTGWIIPDEMKLWSYIGTGVDGMGYVWHYYAPPFINYPEIDLGNLFGELLGGNK